jgi:hypothetical protein
MNPAATVVAPQADARPLAAKLRASLAHLLLSAVIAALVAWLVFGLWYPEHFREASGGADLFRIVLGVDVVLGPALTFVVFDRRKPRRELARDLGVVALLQLGGLFYGLHTVEQARPAVIALERDRLRVVRSIDLTPDELERAPAGLESLRWSGPILVATRQPNEQQKLDAIEKALAGKDIGARPEFWLPPGDVAAAWAAAARPIVDLRAKARERGPIVDAALAQTGRPEATLGYLPVLARRDDTVVFVDKGSGLVVGHALVDGH